MLEVIRIWIMKIRKPNTSNTPHY